MPNGTEEITTQGGASEEKETKQIAKQMNEDLKKKMEIRENPTKQLNQALKVEVQHEEEQAAKAAKEKAEGIIQQQRIEAEDYKKKIASLTADNADLKSRLEQPTPKLRLGSSEATRLFQQSYYERTKEDILTKVEGGFQLFRDIRNGNLTRLKELGFPDKEAQDFVRGLISDNEALDLTGLASIVNNLGEIGVKTIGTETTRKKAKEVAESLTAIADRHKKGEPISNSDAALQAIPESEFAIKGAVIEIINREASQKREQKETPKREELPVVPIPIIPEKPTPKPPTPERSSLKPEDEIELQIKIAHLITQTHNIEGLEGTLSAKGWLDKLPNPESKYTVREILEMAKAGDVSACEPLSKNKGVLSAWFAKSLLNPTGGSSQQEICDALGTINKASTEPNAIPITPKSQAILLGVLTAAEVSTIGKDNPKGQERAKSPQKVADHMNGITKDQNKLKTYSKFTLETDKLEFLTNEMGIRDAVIKYLLWLNSGKPIVFKQANQVPVS